MSRLIDNARQGEPFIIAKVGKPLVKVSALAPENGLIEGRLGCMKGMMKVPDDFDRMGSDNIAQLFAGSADGLTG